MSIDKFHEKRVVHFLLDMEKFVVAQGGVWVAPHQTTSKDETTFEWWKGGRKLTVGIPGEISVAEWLICVWGSNMHDEMLDLQDYVDPKLAAIVLGWVLR